MPMGGRDRWRPLGLPVITPWCFHMAPPPADPGVGAIRLIGVDGRLRLLRRAVTAGELMAEHPRHLVCRSDELLVGQKIPAVPPAETLRPGTVYVLLPAHLFRSVHSFVSLASALLRLLSGDGTKKLAVQQAFQVERAPCGALQIRVCDDLLRDEEGEEDCAYDEIFAGGKKTKAKAAARLCSTETLEREYADLVSYGKSRRWQPKLDTIVEPRRSSRPRALPFLRRRGSSRRR